MSYTENARIADEVMESTLGAQTLAGTPLYQMAASIWRRHDVDRVFTAC